MKRIVLHEIFARVYWIWMSLMVDLGVLHETHYTTWAFEAYAVKGICWLDGWYYTISFILHHLLLVYTGIECCQRHLLTGEFLHSFKDSKILWENPSDLQGVSLSFRNAYIKNTIRGLKMISHTVHTQNQYIDSYLQKQVRIYQKFIGNIIFELCRQVCIYCFQNWCLVQT